MFHSISILEKDNYKNLKKMLYRWCEPKMKKKTATFLNIKKKKLQNEKKNNNVTHILFMPKMKKKNYNISDHF